MTEEPPDPFPFEPGEIAELGDAGPGEPLPPGEREDVLADLADLEVYQALLEHQGVRGLVVDCEDCRVSHYFNWALMRGNLRQLLDVGQARVHEPAFDPDPTDYVSWEYARGYADAVHDIESRR